MTVVLLCDGWGYRAGVSFPTVWPRLAVATVTALALAVPLGVVAYRSGGDPANNGAAQTSAAAVPRNTYRSVTTDAQWASGIPAGTRVSGGSLSIATPAGKRAMNGKSYDWSTWMSQWFIPGHNFTELIPSWTADTPAGTFVEVLVRGRTPGGKLSAFKVLGQWSSRDDFRRTSFGSQADSMASVATDTFKAASGVNYSWYQLRVQLFRTTGTTSTPTMKSVGAVASINPTAVPAVSASYGVYKVLPVPVYSQMIHTGENPEYGGGGEAWCSPTSLAMVLGYYGKLPSPATYAWVNKSFANPWVNSVARSTYDYGYRGTGNWPFNTAHAGTVLPDPFVTRLRSLREAERFTRAGIPLIASISFARGGLYNAPISATNGHLLVIVGFTKEGNVVVNDPAAPDNRTVRRVYLRSQFEKAWLGKSGGLTYVVRDDAHPLPAPSGPNWRPLTRVR